MNTDLNIKNFRIFDSEGVEVSLRPITILTGCNNVGKSSVVKALCLLKDFWQQLKDDIDQGRQMQLERYKIDFHKSPNNILGSLSHVLHIKSKYNIGNIKPENKEETDNCLIFEIVVKSSWLLQDVILRLEFGSLEWDDLNNGYLLAYSIKTLEGRVIYNAKRGEGALMDFSTVKESFLHFLYGQYAFSKWQNTVNYRVATDSYPVGDDEESKLIDETHKNIIQKLGGIALTYLYEWQLFHCKLPWRDGVGSPAPSLLKEVKDQSIVTSSPLLGVYCYFPCLLKFKALDKNDIIQQIRKILKTQEKSISILDQKTANLFLKSFEASEALSLHEYISVMENKRFFVHSHFNSTFNRNSFVYPSSFWTREIDDFPYEESTLPKTANWTIVLLAMDIIEKAISRSSNSYLDFDNINFWINYKSDNCIDGYLRKIIEDIFVNFLPGSLTYSSTMFLQPKRLYSMEDKDDFANSLKKYFELKRLYEEHNSNSLLRHSDKDHKKYKPCLFLNKWLHELNVAHHVQIKSHVDGYGVTVDLFEMEDDNTGMPLIDKGIGVSQLFVLLLKIENAILETKINEALYIPNTTGFNKKLLQYFRTYNQLNPVTIALEEPECHLHPSLQAKIADVLTDANKEYGIHFIVESHSEYLIRKLQLLVGKKEIDNDNVSLLYINSQSRPNYLPVVTNIGIQKDGMLKNEFGSGFFDESLRLSRELFKSKIDDYEE